MVSIDHARASVSDGSLYGKEEKEREERATFQELIDANYVRDY